MTDRLYYSLVIALSLGAISLVAIFKNGESFVAALSVGFCMILMGIFIPPGTFPFDDEQGITQ